jgi:outer membrane protein TolC
MFELIDKFGIRYALLVVSFIIQAFFLNALAQENTAGTNQSDVNYPDLINLADTEYLSIEIPPLSVFLETIEQAPSVQQAKSFEKEQTYRLKVTKNEWLNNIRGVANYSYGSMGSMTESSATGQGTYFQYFGEVMSLYNVGASLTLPLDLFFNRGNRIKTQEATVEQARYQTLKAIEDRKLIITEVYSNVVRLSRLLKVTAEASAISASAVDLTELDYVNGTGSMQDLSEMKRENALSVSNYEELKAELFKAIFQLEIMTGINIIK